MSAEADSYVRMMEHWSSTAKDLTQLALAALILPIFFLRDVAGIAADQPLGRHLNNWFFGSWIALGIAITAGLFYQITSTRLIGDALVGTVARPLYPALQFRLMVVGIIVGIGCFIVGALVGASA